MRFASLDKQPFINPMVKKASLFFLILILIFFDLAGQNPVFALEAASLKRSQMAPEQSIETLMAELGERKGVQAGWSYQFPKDFQLFDEEKPPVDLKDEQALKERFSRLIYNVMGDAFVDEAVKRLNPLVLSDLTGKIKKIIQDRNQIEVLHISINGSILHGLKEASDIDLIVIGRGAWRGSNIDTALRMIIFSLSEILGEEVEGFPDELSVLYFEEDKFSLDAGIFLPGAFPHHNMVEQAHTIYPLTNMTLFGKEFKTQEEPFMRDNLLIAVLKAINNAGIRLFVASDSLHQNETNQKRMGKVLLRLAFSNFYLSYLDKNIPFDKEKYQSMLANIEAGNIDQEAIEALYFELREKALWTANAFGRGGQVHFIIPSEVASIPVEFFDSYEMANAGIEERKRIALLLQKAA